MYAPDPDELSPEPPELLTEVRIVAWTAFICAALAIGGVIALVRL